MASRSWRKRYQQERIDNPTPEMIARRAAYDTKTAPAKLVQLLENPDKSARLGAAKNEKLPKEAMVKVAKKGDSTMRKAVAGNYALFPALQRLLLRDSAIGVLCELARNPSATGDVMEVLVRHKDIRVRTALAEKWRMLPEELQLVLAQDKGPGIAGIKKFENDAGVALALADNSGATGSALHVLAQRSEGFVRLTVAKNRSTQGETLGLLAKDQWVGTRKAVASHDNTPVEALQDLMSDPECWVHLAQNPKLPEDQAIFLALQGDLETRKKVMFHPNLPEKWQLWLGLELETVDWASDSWRHCESKRVQDWLNERRKDPSEIVVEVDKEAGTVCEKWGEVERVVKFLNKEEIDLEVLRPLSPFGKKFGWWSPSMGDEWFCAVDGVLTNDICGGMVPGGGSNMGETKLWNVGWEHGKIWQRGEWEIDEVEGKLVATTWTQKVRDDISPEFPRLQRSYEGIGEPTTFRGLLMIENNLLALWANDEGMEVGWEKVSNLEEARMDHPVQLLDEVGLSEMGIYPFIWDKFEGALRKVAYGREL